MARTPKAEDRKSVQISTSVSTEEFEALEDYRWTERLEKADVLRLAVKEFLINHEIPVKAETPEAPQK